MDKNAEFIRGNQKNYIRICMEDETITEHYEYQMCSYNQINSFLSFQQRSENGKRYLYYEVSSMQSLDIYLQTQRVKRPFILRLSKAIMQLCEEVSEYALDIEKVVLEPRYIMIASDGERIRFLYSFSETVYGMESVESLLELCIERLDYQDERLMEQLFGIYERLSQQKENFVIQPEMQLLYESLQEETIPEQIPVSVHMEAAEQVIQIFPNGIEEEQEEKEKKIQSSTIKNILSAYKRIKKEPFHIRRELCVLLLLDIGILIVWQPFSLLKLFFAVSIGIVFIVLQIQMQQRKKKNQKSQEEVYIQEYEELTMQHKEKTEGTQFISLPNMERMLYSVQASDPKYIYINTEAKIIGKDKEKAQVCICKTGISRIHALVVQEGENCYIEDLNSTNGTRINGEEIKPRTKYALKTGDRVSFAGIEYIFT